MAAEASPPAKRDTAPASCVVYVDDDPEYAALIERLLDRLGYAVMSCSDRSGALAALRVVGAGCKLFITDCKLFADDGIDLACEVESLYPGISVGVISHGYEDIAMRALVAGVPAARKPETLDECAALVARLYLYRAR